MTDVSRQSFFAQWRKLIEQRLPDFQVTVSQIGILGTVGAAIAILAGDPTVSVSMITRLAGNFISNAVEHWRNTKNEKEQDELLQQIVREIQTHNNDNILQASLQELNLAQLAIDNLSVKFDQLVELVKNDFATGQQLTSIIASGAYIGRDVHVQRDFAGRDINNITKYYLITQTADQRINVTPKDLFSQAIKLQLQGALGEALYICRQIKEIDPYFPRIDIEISSMEIDIEKGRREGYINSRGEIQEDRFLRFQRIAIESLKPESHILHFAGHADFNLKNILIRPYAPVSFSKLSLDTFMLIAEKNDSVSQFVLQLPNLHPRRRLLICWALFTDTIVPL